MKQYQFGKIKFFTQDKNLPCWYENDYTGFFVARDKMAKAIKQARKAGKKLKRVTP